MKERIRIMVKYMISSNDQDVINSYTDTLMDIFAEQQVNLTDEEIESAVAYGYSCALTDTKCIFVDVIKRKKAVKEFIGNRSKLSKEQRIAMCSSCGHGHFIN